MKIRKIDYSHSSKKLALSKRSLVTFFGASLIILNIFFTLQMSSLGVKVASLERVYNNLEKANNSLETKLVESSSLLRLEEKSTQLGFMKIQDSLFIKGEGDYTGFAH